MCSEGNWCLSLTFFSPPLINLIEQNESKHDGSPSPGMTDQEKEVAASAYEAFLVAQHPFKHCHNLVNLGCTSWLILCFLSSSLLFLDIILILLNSLSHLFEAIWSPMTTLKMTFLPGDALSGRNCTISHIAIRNLQWYFLSSEHFLILPLLYLTHDIPWII